MGRPKVCWQPPLPVASEREGLSPVSSNLLPYLSLNLMNRVTKLKLVEHVQGLVEKERSRVASQPRGISIYRVVRGPLPARCEQLVLAEERTAHSQD